MTAATNSSFKYIAPKDPSPNLQTVLNFIEASNEQWTSTHRVDRVMDLFDDNLEHRILPKSLARPVLTKSQYREYLLGLMRWIKSLKVTLNDVVEGERAIVIHTSTVGEGTNGASFSSEDMTTFYFAPPAGDSELPKISFVKEFVDSQSTYEFFRAERRRSQNSSKNGC